MASERFKNLPSDKKRRIIEAAIKEFSTNDFEDVSINKIIADAEISRGSFYTYFNDKEDILNYIFSIVLRRKREKLKELFKKNDGDIWKTEEEWMKSILKCVNSDSQVRLFAYTGTAERFVRWIRTKGKRGVIDEFFTDMEESIDENILNTYGDRERLECILILIQSVIGRTVFEIIKKPENREDILRQYNYTMEYIRYGAGAEKREQNR